MGGLFARWSALRMPNRARQVITVCSPIHEPARNFWLPVGPFLRLWRGDDLRMLADEVARPLPAPCTVLFSRKNGLVNLVSLRGRVLSGGLHRNHRGARVDRVQRLGDEDCGRAVGARRAVKGLGSQRGVLPAGSWLGAVIVEVNLRWDFEAGLEAHFIVRTGLASPTAYAVGCPVHDAGHTRSPSHCPFLRGIDMIFATGFQ